MAQAAGRVRRGRGEEGRAASDGGRLHLRAGRQVRGLRLQQERTRRPTRSSAITRPTSRPTIREEFLAASMTLDVGNTDKLAMYHGGGARSRASPSCRPASTPRRSISWPSAERRAATRRDPLFAGGAEEHRRAGGREHRRRAHRQRRLQGPLRFRRRGSTPRRSTSARWRRWPPPAPSIGWRPTARSCTATSSRCWPSPTGSPATRRRAPATSSARGGGGAAKPQIDMRGAEGLDADGAAAVRVRGGRLLPLRPSARCLCERAGQARHPVLRGARGARRSRRGGRAARRHRRLRARAPLAEGQQVRLRHVLRAHRPVRGGDLLRDAGGLAAAAGAGHAPCCSPWRASATARP